MMKPIQELNFLNLMQIPDQPPAREVVGVRVVDLDVVGNMITSARILLRQHQYRLVVLKKYIEELFER